MKKPKMQEIGLERIYRLFELAEKELSQNPNRSRRYISLALEIQKKARARMPPELKEKYCKKCKTFLKQGKNAKINKQGSLTIVKCLECGFERKTGKKPTKQ